MSHNEGNYYGPAVTVSFLVGALAGAAAVLLLAPKARRESAERIREISRDVRERASAAVDTAKDKVSSTVSRGREFLDDKRSVVEAAVEAGKEAYTQGKAKAARIE